MDIDPTYPCAVCPCEAWKHYTSIGTGKSVCLFCVMSALTSTADQKPKNEVAHEFVPDNLRYLENKEKENEAWQGTPGIKYE